MFLWSYAKFQKKGKENEACYQKKNSCTAKLAGIEPEFLNNLLRF